MPTYKYRVRTEEGEVLDSTVEASDRSQALSLVQRRMEGVVISCEETKASARRSSSAGGPPPVPTARRLRLRHGRIRPRDITTYFRQMAVSVNAGMPLREAMESILEDLDHARLREVLQRVTDRLHQGETYSQALTAEGTVFPRLSLALMRTAEESGTMAKTLDDLATTLEKADALTRKLNSIMAYPAFVAGFFVIVMMIMTFFILPQFQDIFDEWDAKLPTLTLVVFTINKWMISHVLWEALIVAALVVGFLAFRRTEVGRWQLDKLKLTFPGFGQLFKQIAMARFCKYFAMMIRGGVPIASALEISASIVENKIIESALLTARERIMLGADIASSLGQHKVFPRLLTRMVSIGESSGRLPETMDRVSDTYEGQVEGSIAVVTALLEPLIIVFFGALVLVMVLAVYLPVFTMSTNIK
jgi:type IV pilus assembly protein PilC